MINKYLCTLYKQRRFISSEDEWPPEQPKHFTAVVLIHHKNRRSKRELIALVEAAKTSNIIQANQSTKTSITLKDITEIFLSSSMSSEDDPCTVLIEGAPGIGKTFLSKHIAYQWANGTLLTQQKMVFLLFLRDPVVQKISCLKDLVMYVYCNDEAAIKNVKICVEYLQNNNGVGLTIILDGYDELPEIIRQKGFLAEIIQRKRLPACNLVVTSRLSASAHFHGNFDRRIEILGFSNDARLDYIRKMLKDVSEQEMLQTYLEKHSIINSYCYIPLNMTILLYLFKEMKQLPNNQTELYNSFICLTICHYLRKDDKTLEMDVLDIHNLPKYYKDAMLNLGKLSLRAIGKNKLVFTISDIKEVFPDIDKNPELIHGFGLLQAVQNFGMTQTEMSFNFIHASVQEFLAAYRISTLPYDEELMILNKKFWVKSYQNTWMMYVGITNGQNKAFKHFLTANMSSCGISSNFLEDPVKCIHMFQCFQEVNDQEQCSTIDNAKIFDNKILDFHGITLLPRDMEALSVFLIESQKQLWDKLDFLLCNMGDTGCGILHSALCNTKVMLGVNELNLGDNQLSSSSSKHIAEISLSRNIKTLYIQGNHLQDGDYLRILAQSDKLEVLDISENEIQTEGAIRIFKAIQSK